MYALVSICKSKKNSLCFQRNTYNPRCLQPQTSPSSPAHCWQPPERLLQAWSEHRRYFVPLRWHLQAEQRQDWEARIGRKFLISKSRSRSPTRFTCSERLLALLHQLRFWAVIGRVHFDIRLEKARLPRRLHSAPERTETLKNFLSSDSLIGQLDTEQENFTSKGNLSSDNS